jgi:hypothetical protein
VHRSLIIARRGVAVLVRTVFIESVSRYRNLFEKTPPTLCAQYTERVPMVKGRLDRKASTATGYAWLVWTNLEPDRRDWCGYRRAERPRNEMRTTEDVVPELRLTNLSKACASYRRQAKIVENGRRYEEKCGFSVGFAGHGVTLIAQ